MQITRPVVVLATKHAHVHKFFEDSVRSYKELTDLIEFHVIYFETATDDQVMILLHLIRLEGVFRRPAFYMIGTTEQVSSNYDLLYEIPLKKIFPTNSRALLDEITTMTGQIIAHRSGGWRNPALDD